MTGPTGFLGKKLIENLSQKHEVIAISRKETGSTKQNVKTIKHDLTLPFPKSIINEINSVDGIVHLATIMPDKTLSHDDISAYEQNVAMTKNLLSAFNHSQAPKFFILSSTVDVYPNLKSILSEKTKPDPQSNYAKAKIECEKICEETIKRWQKTKLFILRISQIYGPGDTHNKAINIFTDNAVAKKPLQIQGDGSDKRTFVHIDDVVLAIKLAMTNKHAGTFNIAGPKPYSLKKLVAIIKTLKRDAIIEYLPRKKAKFDSIISISKARKFLAFKPQFSIEEGVQQLLKHKSPNLFFDLDGPILDVKNRYYNVYKKFIKAHSGKPLTIKKYWGLKRKKISIKDLLQKSSCKSSEDEHIKFLKKFRESAQFIKLDKLQPGAKKALKDLCKTHNIHLVTMRKNPQVLIKQLESLGLTNFFNDILVKFSQESKWRTKAELIKAKNLDSKQGIFIGDTETEILAAKELNFKNITITNGIREASIVKAQKPSYTCKNMLEAKKIIEKEF